MRLFCRQVRLPSHPAGPPDKEDVDRDHGDEDEHPVLALKTEKLEMFNEKPHLVCPILRQNISVSA
jgi:hypothetical protein